MKIPPGAVVVWNPQGRFMGGSDKRFDLVFPEVARDYGLHERGLLPSVIQLQWFTGASFFRRYLERLLHDCLRIGYKRDLDATEGVSLLRAACLYGQSRQPAPGRLVSPRQPYFLFADEIDRLEFTSEGVSE